jgi:hypothetical protein
LGYRCCWTSPLLTDWGVTGLPVHAKFNIGGERSDGTASLRYK